MNVTFPRRTREPEPNHDSHRVRVRVRNMARVMVSILGLGLLIVVYKLLEKWQNVDQSRDQNWPLAIRPADPPSSAFCHVPYFITANNVRCFPSLLPGFINC